MKLAALTMKDHCGQTLEKRGKVLITEKTKELRRANSFVVWMPVEEEDSWKVLKNQGTSEADPDHAKHRLKRKSKEKFFLHKGRRPLTLKLVCTAVRALV